MLFQNSSEPSLVRVAQRLALWDLLAAGFSTLSAQYCPSTVPRPQQAPKLLLSQGPLHAGTEGCPAEPNSCLQCILCSINHIITHTMLKTQSRSTPPTALLREDGKKRHQTLHVFNVTVFGFLFQIDHKSTFKNSKPAFLLLVPLLSFDFFLILSFLYVCAWRFFFPFIWLKSEDSIIVLWSPSAIIFFFPWNQT